MADRRREFDEATLQVTEGIVERLGEKGQALRGEGCETHGYRSARSRALS